MERASCKIDAGVAQLRLELADGIAQLEEHYYSSMVLHDAPPSHADTLVVPRLLHEFPRPLP